MKIWTRFHIGSSDICSVISTKIWKYNGARWNLKESSKSVALLDKFYTATLSQCQTGRVAWKDYVKNLVWGQNTYGQLYFCLFFFVRYFWLCLPRKHREKNPEETTIDLLVQLFFLLLLSFLWEMNGVGCGMREKRLSQSKGPWN